ncbi:penicillin acylase family protein [Gilvimarinus sp. F26214L]|uniref:penicillin acylase family protein n=1 Tax=Gilvimarinus sp. DZF01 TaxID=3461371 RepID=UPI00404590C9
MTRAVSWIKRIIIAALALVVVAGFWLWWSLNGSLAILDGEQTLAGLESAVTVERDGQGIPTIRAETRRDTAFALGFLHGQERFFQMDLLRRNSAGELAALVGEAALPHDRRIRIHQMRKRAERALEQADAGQLALLDSYASGVNAGLAALAKSPFEYLLLRTDPQPWVPADSILALYSMYMDLQPEWNEHERSVAVLRDLLPEDWYRFLTPRGGQWDSPIHGERFDWRADFPQQALAELQQEQQVAADWNYRDSIELGSNNWSVSGVLNGYRAGTVANDMHLGLSVPNIWYRASWYLDDGRRVTGATLPGAPTLVVGSNEHIAWGFTNSYGDYHDSIILNTNAGQSAYMTEEGWEDFRTEVEQVQVSGGEAIPVEVRLTRWGPVIGEDHKGNLLALRWVAHDPEAANLNLLGMETADTVHDALTIAATAGMPGQNLNVVDHLGNQAWTIMGRLPRRFGYSEAGLSPLEPADWSNGELGWDGYLTAEEYPRVVNPEHGRIWTANARIVSDELLATVGWGDYALGARQQQIETGLFARETLSEQDLLDIALDDRALFLERWQQLFVAVLEHSENADLKELKNHVSDWGARASADSVGYLAVKVFREEVIDNTLGEVVRHVADRTNTEEQQVFWPVYVDSMFEYPAWTLVSSRPAQHVPAGYPDWPSFLSAMATQTLERLTEDGEELAEQTWGKYNTLAIQHPLSRALPVLSRWLDMPAEPMPGDTYMPRVQRQSSGASERMVVAPGHEENGIFHMATGQSGHPLSPYYDKGHRDWVEGNPSSFLPGEVAWRLVLQPE